MPKREMVGTVTRDKSDKSRRVEIDRQIKDPKYGKILRRKTVCHAHDETNQSHVGDTVRIVESRRISKTKRWELVEVVAKSQQVDIAALKAAGAAAEEMTE
jgi:small subunit ribosomal protein S17